MFWITGPELRIGGYSFKLPHQALGARKAAGASHLNGLYCEKVKGECCPFICIGHHYCSFDINCSGADLGFGGPVGALLFANDNTGAALWPAAFNKRSRLIKQARGRTGSVLSAGAAVSESSGEPSVESSINNLVGEPTGEPLGLCPSSSCSASLRVAYAKRARGDANDSALGDCAAAAATTASTSRSCLDANCKASPSCRTDASTTARLSCKGAAADCKAEPFSVTAASTTSGSLRAARPHRGKPPRGKFCTQALARWRSLRKCEGANLIADPCRARAISTRARSPFKAALACTRFKPLRVRASSTNERSPLKASEQYLNASPFSATATKHTSRSEQADLNAQ